VTRKKLYIVELTADERVYLNTVISTGKHPARKILRANILLKADVNGPGWNDKKIQDAFEISSTTVENCRKQFVLDGLDVSVNRKKYVASRFLRKIDGSQEAKLIAIVMGDPPVGKERWTLRLLSERLVELKIVENISHETVRQTLKKMNLSLGTKNHG
jgi:transposase